jgi:hypothetical protein
MTWETKSPFEVESIYNSRSFEEEGIAALELLTRFISVSGELTDGTSL